jgi:VCBS repeat-containing protein
MLSYSATLSDNSPLPTWLSFDGLTRTFSGTPTNADVGSIDIKVTADDGSSNVTDTFTLVVNNVNDPPVIGGVDTGAVTEDVGVIGGNISTTGSLTVADPDAGESSFQTATITGSFGDLTIDTAGNWIYTADNTQAAIQALDVGQTLVDTLTVSAFDGTTHNIVITINGAEDAAVIGGVAVGAVAEDGILSVSDTLTITDADSSDNPVSFNDLPPTLGDNGYGNFEITGNTWTYTLNNAHASVQGLDVGETLTDTYTFSASDGSPSLVIVTIDGAEDLPILGGVTIGAVSEDGTLVTSNTLTITDADTSDNPVSFDDVTPTLGANGYGTFEITGNTWTFTLDNAHAAVQGLDAGESLNDSFTFTASDGSMQLVSVTINGAEDAPTLDNAITDQTATEGTAFSFTFAANTFGDLDASDTLTYTATLSDSSPLPAWLSFDGATRSFSGTPGAGDVGAIDIRITADDASSTITDTFTLTIDPFNNLPVIGGADRGALTEDLNVVDGMVAASGALTIVDADAGESSFVAGTVNGALGSLTIDAAGNWSYSADNSNPEIQALQAGQTISEALTVTTADGSTHEVVVTINGAQEAAPPPVVEPPVVEPPPEEEIPPPEEEVKVEAGSGEDEILPEITRLPQGSTPPVPERVESDVVKADEPEGEVVNFGPVADKQVPRAAPQLQVLQAQNLDVDSLTLQVSDDEALNEQYELELLDRIDSMHLGMDSDGARRWRTAKRG